MEVSNARKCAIDKRNSTQPKRTRTRRKPSPRPARKPVIPNLRDVAALVTALAKLASNLNLKGWF